MLAGLICERGLMIVNMLPILFIALVGWRTDASAYAAPGLLAATECDRGDADAPLRGTFAASCAPGMPRR